MIIQISLKQLEMFYQYDESFSSNDFIDKILACKMISQNLFVLIKYQTDG